MPIALNISVDCKQSEQELSMDGSLSVADAIIDLQIDPVRFLTEIRVIPVCDDTHLYDTSIINTNLSIDEYNVLRLKQSERNEVDINILYTKMRSTEASDRFMVASIVQLQADGIIINNNERPSIIHYQDHPIVWLTPQQNGCSVLIINYGKAENGYVQYSMIHMQPRDGDAYIDELAIDSFCNTQEIFLEYDSVKAVPSDRAPVEYILVHSEEALCLNEQLIQIMGISCSDGEFIFYKQMYDAFSCGEKNLVEKLEWRKWVTAA